jgi:archaellum biogenesis ATPase FlaH
VLRFPGTTNHKYSSKPRVKVLWDDGPSYTLEQLRRKLPDDPQTKIGAGLNPREIYSKYEKHMPPWLRRELLAGKPQAGKRSDMLWKIEHALLDLGMTRAESFVVVKASPWNKFKGRYNEDAQLDREIDKIIDGRLSAKDEQLVRAERDVSYKFLRQSLAEVEEEHLDWFWYPYLARGELSILEGDPGLGKSYLAQMVSKGIVDGEKLPSVKAAAPVKGKVAYFDIENSAGSVTKKRMTGNGCKNLEWFYQEEEPFTIDDDDKFDAVLDAIEELKPILVVFDTINTYIGKADTNNSKEVQQAFARFKDIAKRFNCAVLVLRHLTKSTKNDKALYRGQGSIAFAGLARVVMTVGQSPDEPQDRVMAVTKINVAKTPKAITFRVQELPDTLKEQDRSQFIWGQFVDLTSDDIVSVNANGKVNGHGDPLLDCSNFLKDILADDEMEAIKIKSMAEKRGFGVRVLNDAAEALGIVKETVGFGKNRISYWSLPG